MRQLPTVRRDHLFCHRWPRGTVCFVMNGPGGPLIRGTVHSIAGLHTIVHSTKKPCKTLFLRRGVGSGDITIPTFIPTSDNLFEPKDLNLV